MVTGRDALFSVEQAIGRVRADESQLDGALRSAIDEAARLRREEAEGFRVLARIKLDGMVREQVMQELDATERRALAMLDGHRKALEALGQRRDAAQAALTKAEQIKHERDQALANALEELDELRGATSERVRSDPAWQAAKAAVDDAQHIAEASESKAKVSEEDLAEKRQPYEADPLFMYLWKKKHGTGEDRSSNFVRWLDRKVAALIGYADARPNYAMLNEIPLRLREHARQKLDDVTAARERLAAVEQTALAASGSQPLEAKAAAAHQAVQAAEQQVAKATAELHQIDADHEKSIGGGDEAAYGGAIDLLAQSLAREDMRALYRDAYETPTPADEQALNAIANARKKLEKADAEVAQIRNQIRDIAKRRGELEGARDRARSQGYDSPLGTIANSAILAQVLTGILQGAMRGSDLDKVFRDNYRRREPRADPDFGGPGSWGGGSGPWGGSSGGSPWGGGGGGGGGGSWGGGGGGGGGSSGGGGGGGGGWKTGGSF